MLQTVDRMLMGDVLRTLLAVVGVLLLIVAGNRFVGFLAMAAGGEISGATVFVLLGLRTVRTVGMLIAPSFLFAILFALGRMHRDNEMVVLSACGCSPLRPYRAIFAVALPLALLAGVLSIELMPWAERMYDQVRADQKNVSSVQALLAGRFMEKRGGKTIVYIERLSADEQQMENVFIADASSARGGIVYARSGHQETNQETGERFVVLQDGYRYDGNPGQADYRIAKFEQYRVRIKAPRAERAWLRLNASPIGVLWGGPDPRQKAEVQSRIAIPLSVLVLGLLAVPFSRATPRSGRSGNLLYAVLLYFIYANGLAVAQSLVEKGTLPPWLGLWWVHLLVIGIAVVTLWTQRRPVGHRGVLGWLRP